MESLKGNGFFSEEELSDLNNITSFLNQDNLDLKKLFLEDSSDVELPVIEEGQNNVFNEFEKTIDDKANEETLNQSDIESITSNKKELPKENEVVEVYNSTNNTKALNKKGIVEQQIEKKEKQEFSTNKNKESGKSSNIQLNNADLTTKSKVNEDKKQNVTSDNAFQYLLNQAVADYKMIANMPKDEIVEDLLEAFKSEFMFVKGKLEQAIKQFEGMEEQEGFSEIKRHLHSIKGGFNTVGLSRMGKEIHFLESLMADLLDKPEEEKQYIFNLFKKRLEHLYFSYEEMEIDPDFVFFPLTFNGKVNVTDKKTVSTAQTNPVNKIENAVKKSNTSFNKDKKEVANKNEGKQSNSSAKKEEKENIFVPLKDINMVIDKQNQFKIINSNLISENFFLNSYLEDFEDVILRIQKNIGDLSDYAEGSIKSNIPDSHHSKYDPLLMDQFTKLQDFSRSLVENFLDLEEVKNNLKSKIKNQSQNFDKSNEIATESLDTLTKIRLVDFADLSHRFELAAQKASAELGKDIDFEVIDNGVKIDITLTNKIKGPIELIIKNSIAHGIEDSAEERIEKGKSEKGKITMTVKQFANSLYITLADDGKGLDIEKIRKKAIEKGFAKESDNFGLKEAIHCILQQGFSTADKVDNISGRGVGLDSVQVQVLALGGTFNIDSKSGKGTSVVISIPTSYTTTYGLIVKVANENIVVLNSLIKEVLSFNKKEFKKIEENKSLNYESKEIDFRRFSNILNVKEKENDNKLFYKVLVLEHKNELMAVSVEDIVENKEVLIKGVNSSLKQIPGLTGVTMLADGSPSYVINPIFCKRYELNRLGVSLKEGELMPKELFNEELKINSSDFFIPTILIVDDSATVRKHTEKFLSNNRFKYVSAKNGKDALDKLPHEKIDLILLDIEMPEMNGFEFAEIIKQNEKYKNIPIIMITSRSNELHKTKAKDIGVNEYMIKPFVPQELLKFIKKYGYINK